MCTVIFLLKCIKRVLGLQRRKLIYYRCGKASTLTNDGWGVGKVEVIYEWMGMIQLGSFLLGGLLLPFWLKRMVWLKFVAVGYCFYVLWGLYSWYGPQDGLWANYERMMLPYLAVISLIGYVLQKLADQGDKGSEQ